MTAKRWMKVLRSLGHRVKIQDAYAGENVDVLVGLHARRSAASIMAFRKRYPDRLLIVALTGTDLYQDLGGSPRRSRAVRQSIEVADRLIVLQRAALDALPLAVRKKSHVVHQSVMARPRRAKRSRDRFEVSVLSHLRPVKDPLRAALASRHLPDNSRIRILQVGKALSVDMATRARAEMARNPRYLWLGERSEAAARSLLERSRLMVLSSLEEGGANVIGEAAVADVPILATRIAGNVGLLGSRHPGLFPVGNSAALAALLWRAERDPRFYVRLERATRRIAPLFHPEREKLAWERLLKPLTGCPRRG